MIYTVNLIQKDNNGILTTTNVTSKCLTGFSKVEKLDDSLDIAQLVLKSGTPIDYKIFDTIQVKDDKNNTLIDMRISGDEIELESRSPLTYRYNISLVEHTKILELFIVSAKTFTQPTDGTIEYTLYDVIDILRRTTPFETVSNTDDYVVFEMPTLGSDLDVYLKGIDAPEFTFNNVTLREAYKEICDYVDGIPRLVREEDGTLRFSIDFVGEVKNLIADQTIITNINKQIDNTFYAKELESEALNLVSDKLYSEAVEIYPARDSFINFRRPDDFFQSDFEGSVLPTPKPIYDVASVVVQTSVLVENIEGTPNIIVNKEQLICNMPYGIVEENTYNLLSFKNYIIEDRTKIRGTEVQENNKNNSLYYSYKEKNITIGETYGLFDTQEVLQNWITRAVIQQLITDGTISDTGGTSGTNFTTDLYQVRLRFSDSSPVDIKDTLLQIHYVPIPDSTRVNIDKQNISEVNKYSTMLANQQGRVINLEQYSNNLQGKINRIGNSDLKISYRVKDVESDKYYGVGDYMQPALYIGTQRESIFYKDYIYVKLDLTRDFNKISSFIGVNSEIREYEIGEKNTLNRNLLYKEYVEIDVVASGNGSSDSQLLTADGRETYINTFNEASSLKAVGGGIISESETFNFTLVSPSSNGGGNSLIFAYKVEDNKSVSFYKKEQDNQIAKEFIPYTDDSGKMDNIRIRLIDGLNLIELTESDKEDIYDIASTLPLLKPYGSETSVLDRINKTLINTAFFVSKDNREIIGQVLQLQQVSKDTTKVVLGRALSQRNRLVSELPPQLLKIYVYNDGTQYNNTDNLTVKSGYDSILFPSRTISTTNNKVVINQDFSVYDSYAIADEDDRLILAVNNNRVNLNTITFDFNNKRSGIIYKY